MYKMQIVIHQSAATSLNNNFTAWFYEKLYQASLRRVDYGYSACIVFVE